VKLLNKMKCNICKTESVFLFKNLVLNKYKVAYYRCPKCDFIQTEKPFWLDEAYGNAITDLDIGLVSRNINFSNLIEKIIKNNFDFKKKFLDYAGGYGLFVRLMRDKGFHFYREDKFCENIFAKNYDLNDLSGENKFEIVTAFEVFEHLENPLEEIEKMFRYADTVMFSTDLQPDQEIKSIDDWWYFTPQTGQHIAFYSKKTLQYIAEKLHYFFYSYENLHLMSKRVFTQNPLLIADFDQKEREIKLESLVQSDFEFSKNLISKVDEVKKQSIDEEKNIDEDIKKEQYIKKLSLALVQLDTTKTALDTTKTALDTTKTALDTTKTELDTTKTALDTTKTALDTTKTELDTTKTQLDIRVNELNNIYVSREWQTISILQKTVKIFIPKNSIRRWFAVKIWRLIKFSVKFLLKIKREVKNMLFLFVNYFVKFKPRKKRKINKNSKKIVYIGHSYHNKTKSTAFLIDYLKEFYDVEVILDESWLGKPYPDLSFIDDSYLGVIFFQLLPTVDIIRTIKHDNIIYFPMYDQSGRLDYEFWHKYQNIKIINFSKTLHNKLFDWGFESMFVQYFPKIQNFIAGKKDEVFFWQRLTKININIISKLFDDTNVKMHIHKAIDPDQKFQNPDEKQEKKFQITYSDWFETREEMWNVIKQKGIYIAPREYEGIGMSFLEAMAMGKAVVAVDNPTMNEYITHGENGYLFDLKHPKEIDLLNIEQVQKNAYEFMKNGYKRWGKNKHKIIEFIEKA